jgi:hypothetical protein
VTLEEFVADPGYRDALQSSRIRCPWCSCTSRRRPRSTRGRPVLSPEAQRIWSRLEQDLGTRIVTMGSVPDVPKRPPTIDLEPFDGHPNLDGLLFYGDYVARAIASHVAHPPAAAAAGGGGR